MDVVAGDGGWAEDWLVEGLDGSRLGHEGRGGRGGHAGRAGCWW